MVGDGVTDIVAEALYLDLGQGKNLFVTLTNHRSGREGRGIGLDGSNGVVWLPFGVFDLRYEPGEEREITRQVLAAKAAGSEGRTIPRASHHGHVCRPHGSDDDDTRRSARSRGQLRAGLRLEERDHRDHR